MNSPLTIVGAFLAASAYQPYGTRAERKVKKEKRNKKKRSDRKRQKASRRANR